jgi:hypothetical protein
MQLYGVDLNVKCRRQEKLEHPVERINPTVDRLHDKMLRVGG